MGEAGGRDHKEIFAAGVFDVNDGLVGVGYVSKKRV